MCAEHTTSLWVFAQNQYVARTPSVTLQKYYISVMLFRFMLVPSKTPYNLGLNVESLPLTLCLRRAAYR